MRLPRFEYVLPKTIDEAIAVLSEEREAKLIAGGTDILVSMKQRVTTPKQLVSLREIRNIEYIDNGNGNLRIGALTTLNSIEESAIVKEKFPMLARSAGDVGAPQHRYAGTIAGNICLDTRCIYYNQSHFWRKCRPVCYKLGGEEANCSGFETWQGFPSPKGNVCYAVYSGDTAPSLIALGAEVKINGPEGERVIPLRTLFTGDGKKPFTLGPGDILTEVILPNPSQYSAGVYLKLRLREAIDFALVGVAANISLDSKGGVCEEARLVIGAVASKPVEVAIAEDILVGKRITDNLIKEVSEAAYSEAPPLPNISGCSQEYRKKMVRVLARRAITSALDKI
ncbi:MAG: xanthine dehydrogenase family protein subunit M [Thermodesulfobacteriota bacterium]|nr:xanthine dehydrogenase family protein subunit M [Thermodesulfobacteriota bacterium]